MYMQIENEVLVWKIVSAIIGVVLPIAVLLIWRRRTGANWKPVIVGAVTFVVFAQILEGIPKYIFFGGTTAISQYVWSHAWAYVLIGCLLAGLFEEVGRYTAFRFILKNPQDKSEAISYGIGHGGIEAILILGITGLSGIGMALLVNSGEIGQSLAGLNDVQLQSVEQQLEALSQYGFAKMLIDVVERVFAMALHIGLSIMVFRSVGEHKMQYLGLAILLHMIFDVPAAMYQCGIIGIGLAEIGLAVAAFVIVVYAYKMYNRKDV